LTVLCAKTLPVSGVGLRPHRHPVVAGAAHVRVGDAGVGDAVVEVQPVGRLVEDSQARDPHAIERPVEPDAELVVLEPQVVDA